MSRNEADKWYTTGIKRGAMLKLDRGPIVINKKTLEDIVIAEILGTMLANLLGNR
jgi:hypothetical protein